MGIGVVLNGSLLAVALQAGGDEPPDETEAVEALTVAPRSARVRVIEEIYRVPVEEFPEPRRTHSQKGEATWFHAPKGTCAHKSIAKGTMVTVIRPDTGASVTCKVADRGPYGPGRVIDLSRDTFVALAGADVGVLQVRIEW